MPAAKAPSSRDEYQPLPIPADTQEDATMIERAESAPAPSGPKNYPDAKKLVTEDCIQPA